MNGRAKNGNIISLFTVFRLLSDIEMQHPVQIQQNFTAQKLIRCWREWWTKRISPLKNEYFLTREINWHFFLSSNERNPYINIHIGFRFFSPQIWHKNIRSDFSSQKVCFCDDSDEMIFSLYVTMRAYGACVSLFIRFRIFSGIDMEHPRGFHHSKWTLFKMSFILCAT